MELDGRINSIYYSHNYRGIPDITRNIFGKIFCILFFVGSFFFIIDPSYRFIRNYQQVIKRQQLRNLENTEIDWHKEFFSQIFYNTEINGNEYQNKIFSLKGNSKEELKDSSLEKKIYLNSSISYNDYGFRLFDKSSSFDGLEEERLKSDEIFSKSNKNHKKAKRNKIAFDFTNGLNQKNYYNNKNFFKIVEEGKIKNINYLGDLIDKEQNFKLSKSANYLLKSNSSLNEIKTINITSILNIIDKNSDISINDYEKTNRNLRNMLGISHYYNKKSLFL